MDITFHSGIFALGNDALVAIKEESVCFKEVHNLFPLRQKSFVFVLSLR